MLGKLEKDQIRHILQSPQWRTIEKFAEEYVQGLKDGSNLRSTEWETAAACLMEEGQISGIRNFIQELYKQSQ